MSHQIILVLVLLEWLKAIHTMKKRMFMRLRVAVKVDGSSSMQIESELIEGEVISRYRVFFTL